MTKRALLMVPALAMFLTAGCAVQGAYYVRTAPPPPRAEVYGYAPGPGYVWVGGSWDWRDRWVWRQGYWSRPPRPNARWTSGYWSSGPRGYHYVRGYWR